MYQATLYFKQHKDCVLNRLLDGKDGSIAIEIEEVQDEMVTFVLHAGDSADEFYEQLATTDHVTEVVTLDDDTLLVTKPSCGAYSAIYRNHGTLRRRNTVAGSQRVYNVLFFRREDLRRIISDMREIGTVSLGRLEEVGDVDTELTDRQRAVVTHALESGYYEWPRAVTSEALAEEFDISRATLHEHLRKAEAKLIADALAAEADPGAVFSSDTGLADAAD